MMLANVVNLHMPQLAGLADSWIASGAKGFAVWERDKQLVAWPSGFWEVQDGLSAEIKLNGTKLGELMVQAPDSLVNRMRLEAEANLIASLVTIARETSNTRAFGSEVDDFSSDLFQMLAHNENELKLALKNTAGELAMRIRASGIFVRTRLQNGQECWIEFGQVPSERTWLTNCIDQLEVERLQFPRLVQNIPGRGFESITLVLLSIPSRGVAKMIMGLTFEAGRPILERDKNLIMKLASYTGLQIEYAILLQMKNARSKLDFELRIAERLQRRLLCQQTPVVPTLDLFAMSQSASSVGGDFYDFISHPSGPFFFAVCDISGNGLPAAMLVAMTRMVVRRFAREEQGTSPGAVVDKINAELYDDFSQVNMLATMFVGCYDPVARRLHYVNAGHSPVIFHSARNSSRFLEANTVPIGIFPKSQVDNQKLELEVGDVLVVGTDGLNEARNEQGEMFGYQKMAEIVIAMAGRSAQRIAEALHEAVAIFSGGDYQEDDQTLVVCKGV